MSSTITIPEHLKNTPRDQLRMWVRFPNGAAKVMLVDMAEKGRGLVIVTKDSLEGASVLRGALELGLAPLKNPLHAGRVYSDRKIPFSSKSIAEALGAELFVLSADELASPEYTHDVAAKAKADAAKAEADARAEQLRLKREKEEAERAAERLRRKEEQARLDAEAEAREMARLQHNAPDETATPLGRNGAGKMVYQDARGRTVETGDARDPFRREPETGGNLEYLRIRSEGDIAAMADGLTRQAMLEDVPASNIKAMIAAGVEGQDVYSEAKVSDLLRENLFRQIASQSVAKNGDRASFARASLVASRLSPFMSSRPSADGEMLSPSPVFTAFLARTSRTAKEVSFHGHADMMHGLPAVQRPGSSFQVHDFSGRDPRAMVNACLGLLSDRTDEGRSLLLLPRNIDAETFDLLRLEIARHYALEASASVAGHVADGVEGGRDLLFVSVGERRPEPLDDVPPAAMRVFEVQDAAGFGNLEMEILRAQARIRAYHEGRDATANDKEANERQKPYVALSTVRPPITMSPMALEGAQNKAKRRVQAFAEPFGGVDAMVAKALGETNASLGEKMLAEQVDALAFWMNARSRNRSFLLSDQAGVGKSHPMSGATKAFLREAPGNRVIYFTESAPINVPDVFENLQRFGISADKIMMMTSKSTGHVLEMNPETGTLERSGKVKEQVSAAARKRIFESGAWPEGVDVIITSYSQFRKDIADPSTRWLKDIASEQTFAVIDEAQNALNPNSRQGAAVRGLLTRLPRNNKFFGTATPLREISGLDLYQDCLPEKVKASKLLRAISSGGTVGLEAFAGAMAADGVSRRVDHDLSGTEMVVDMPDEDLRAYYETVVGDMHLVVKTMIENLGFVRDRNLEIYNRAYANAINRGAAPSTAAAEARKRASNSISFDRHLEDIQRVTMNAIKVHQVVRRNIREIEEGRKPMVSLHSTHNALLKEMISDENGQIIPGALDEMRHISLRDHLHRIHERMYRVRREDEFIDLRETNEDARERYEQGRAMIDAFPHDLTPSPLDAMAKQLEEAGLSFGELTGRAYSYDDGKISRRERPSLRDVVDQYQDGTIDIIAYNSAGATGGNFQASPHVRDQRPRSTLVGEIGTDIIKYQQALYRGNRYGQVAPARLVSVLSGLMMERKMHLMADAKLRAMGAVTDGNRSHPLLREDIPDLLNPLGDRAVANILAEDPQLARDLCFDDFVDGNAAERYGVGTGLDSFKSVSDVNASTLAGPFMVRASLGLDPARQAEVMARIDMEFIAMREMLQQQGIDPLRPRVLEGHIEIKAKTIFEGKEADPNDLDASEFDAPLYLVTGIHHYTKEAIKSDEVLDMIADSRRRRGGNPFASCAARLEQQMPALLAPHLFNGVSIERAMANPEFGGVSFERQHAKLTNMIAALKKIEPGKSLHFDDYTAFFDSGHTTIVDVVPPVIGHFIDQASAYDIKFVRPGDSTVSTVSLSRLLMDKDQFDTGPGVSLGADPAYLEQFDEDGSRMRKMPVQILQGNPLTALTYARQHRLGNHTQYTDQHGQVLQGIVFDPKKVDLEMLPIITSDAAHLAAFVERARDTWDGHRYEMLKGSFSPEKNDINDWGQADIMALVRAGEVKFNILPLRKGSYAEYASRPGLYELLHGQPLPEKDKAPSRVRHVNNFTCDNTVVISTRTDEGVARVGRIFAALNVDIVLGPKCREDFNLADPMKLHDVVEAQAARPAPVALPGLPPIDMTSAERQAVFDTVLDGAAGDFQFDDDEPVLDEALEEDAPEAEEEEEMEFNYG